jgi:multidrug efflux system membrane fusion protein
VKSFNFRFFPIIPVLLAFLACSGGQQNQNARPQAAAVPVTVGTVSQKDVPVQLRAVGTVEAFSTVSMKPQVGGVLTDVHFKEGQDVKKGDLLFTIDPRPYQAMVAQAQANLTKDQAQAQHAREEVQRYQDLVKKDFVTQEQFEQIRTDAASTAASVEGDQAALQTARLQLSYCTIRSPLDGRTGNLMVHAGNVVKANETDLVSIHQIRPINVSFSVPEKNLPRIREHMSAGHLIVQAQTSATGQVDLLDGSLNFINNAVDRQTGTILLKAIFSNQEGALWPGQFVDVILTLTTQKNAIVVPSEAVQTGQQGEYVYVVKPDLTVELRPVLVSNSGEKETVIAKGLNKGERVVTDGQLNLIPGARVEIKTSAAEGKVSS